MKRYYLGIFLLSLILFKIDVAAISIKEKDIPVNSYVIGTHLFTREKNENYNGVLTTKYIMLGSSKIGSEEIENMLIYYKDPRGSWYDELAEQKIEMSEVLEIEYINTLKVDEKISPDGTINNLSFGIAKNDKGSAVRNSKGINAALEYASKNNIQNVKLENGTYYISADEYFYIPSSTTPRHYAIKLVNNVNFDLNESELILIPNNYPRYVIFLLRGVHNVGVYNGIIVGDRNEHKCAKSEDKIETVKKCENDSSLQTHEWGHVMHIDDSKNIVVDDLDLSMGTGDGIAISTSNNIDITNNNIHYVRRNGISIISGKNINILNNEIHDIVGTDPQSGIDIERDQLTQSYEDINIQSNRIYNTEKYSVCIYEKVTNLNITSNYLENVITTKTKARNEFSKENNNLYKFPTESNDEDLMEIYNIAVSNNRVIEFDNEHELSDRTQYKPGFNSINKLNYIGYNELTGISTDSYTYELKVEETYTIPVKYTPSNATYKILTYKSDNQNIATVSKTGKITAISEGKTNITVTANDYGKNSQDDSDNKEFSFTIEIIVTKKNN